MYTYNVYTTCMYMYMYMPTHPLGHSLPAGPRPSVVSIQQSQDIQSRDDSWYAKYATVHTQ